MAHRSMKDVTRQAVWITGTPGCGFNTIGAKLGGFMTDLIGYRHSHVNHREWFISLEVLRYKITDPELRNPYFYGFGQNYREVLTEPWKTIFFIRVSKDILLRRVKQYRISQKIKDGDTHKNVGIRLFNLQELFFAQAIKFMNVVEIDGDLPVSEVVELINPNFKESHHLNHVP